MRAEAAWSGRRVSQSASVCLRVVAAILRADQAAMCTSPHQSPYLSIHGADHNHSLAQPISTCRPIGDGPQQEQCGIIVGAKKTTIYAVDPLTGKVQWTQDPMGGAGGRGYTKHPPKNDASRGRTVLLQREDYAVRHLNTEGGEEVWKVELGRFSALDFDVDAAGGGRSGGGATPPGRRGAGPDAHEDDDVLGGDAMAAGGDHVVGGRRRGAAAVAASEKKKGGVPPILGGRRKGSLHDFDSVFGDDAHGGGGKDCLFGHHEDDFVHDHSHFRGFPSVAFGEDGTSVMAVDGISGELLWKRRIESVVTAVYGVGKESSWIPLDVIEESDVFSHGHSTPLSTSPRPTSSPHSGGLVPYGAGQMESGKLHRLGRHHSNLFVSSMFDPLGGHDSDPFSQPDADDLPYENEIGAPLPPRVGGLEQESLPLDGYITMNPSELPTNGVKPPASHRTENGLYLTWSMVAAIVLMLLSVIVFVARVIILRQKKKLASASVDMTTASSSSQEGRQRAQSSGGDFLSADGRNLTEPLAGNIWLKNGKYPAVTRSVSLDALGSNSFGSPGTNVAPNLISEKLRPIIPPPNLSSVTRPRLQSTDRGTSTTAPNTLSPTVPRSMTLPLETSPPNARSTQQQAQPGVDNIDGVPLVRYSRYRSEFKEMSALGRGGFGTVFQCENVLDSREYAIKKIKIVSQLGMDGIATKRFSQKLHRVLREVKILALLDHPNIVRYYTAWLEVDDGIQNEDDDTNITSSMYDKKSNGIFSSSLFSGFGSRSLSPKKSNQQRRTKGLLGSYNPLGWNNFGSFRLDEPQSEASSSFGTQQNDAPFTSPPSDDGEDLGFTWERSNENTAGPSLNAKNKGPTKILEHSVKEESKSSESTDKTPKASKSKSATRSKCDKKNSLSLTERQKDEDCGKKITEGRHILFIQMQLCSSQTLADFLANRQARTGAVSQSLSEASTYAVDIPFALRLFAQIAHGVKYVHKQGLIHRDLKPQNCFIDEAGNVKVGDFGLSRESASAGDITDFDESAQEETPAFVDAENTAGVGTRAYASPEQMRGSNYDASTDVYSLGIILFELCVSEGSFELLLLKLSTYIHTPTSSIHSQYPMYTAMERYKEFSGIRKGAFPSYWDSHVKSSFPTMHDLLVQMISISAAERPSADAVSDHMDSLLREYSVQSLDKSWGKKGALLLRVETEEKDGVLASAMKLIKESAPDSKILQYGLRGQAARAIMEFALQIKDDDRKASVQRISSRLHDHAMNVRQLSDS
ncbi:hypothetical protein ACHAWF_017830 [Thalassiosira exigua]